MPITTATQIIIALAGQTNQPTPSSQYLMVNRVIHLWELPSINSCTFALRVSEGDNSREFRLSATESDQLTTFLAQLPTQNMVSEGMSFDGTMYELIIIRPEQTLSFHWKNDDWRYAPQSPLNKWKRVAALADYVLKLANKPQKG